MTVREILKMGDERLLRTAQAVTAFDRRRTSCSARAAPRLAATRCKVSPKRDTLEVLI